MAANRPSASSTGSGTTVRFSVQPVNVDCPPPADKSAKNNVHAPFAADPFNADKLPAA